MPQSTINPVKIKPEMPTNFWHASGKSSDCVDFHISSMPVLLSPSSPFAIQRPAALNTLSTSTATVISIIVNSMQAEFWRAMTECGKQIGEGLKSLADTNSSTSPLWIISACDTGASLNHSTPRTINVASISRSEPMLGYDFLVKTAARLCRLIFGGEAVICDGFGSATIAEANRGSSECSIAARFERSVSNNLELSKALANERDFSRHNEHLSLCSAVGDRQQPALTAIMED